MLNDKREKQFSARATTATIEKIDKVCKEKNINKSDFLEISANNEFKKINKTKK